MVLLEQPLLILFFGTLLIAVAAVVWVQTGHRQAFWALSLLVVLVGIGLVVERLVETPAEQVRATLRSIVERLEANDPEGVIAHLSPQADAIRDAVRQYMKRVRVVKISVKRNLKVTCGSGRSHESAEARFNAVATVNVSGSEDERMTIPRFLVVRFRREEGAWRVRDYQSFDPIRGDVHSIDAFE